MMQVCLIIPIVNSFLDFQASVWRHREGFPDMSLGLWGRTHTRQSVPVPYSSTIALPLCRWSVLTLGNLHWAWVRLPLVHIGCVSVHVSVSAPKHLYHGLSTPLRSVLRPRNVLGHRTDGLVWVCPECFCNRGWLCIYCFVCLRHFVILNPSPEPCPKWFISVPIAVVLKRVYAYP